MWRNGSGEGRAVDSHGIPTAHWKHPKGFGGGVNRKAREVRGGVPSPHLWCNRRPRGITIDVGEFDTADTRGLAWHDNWPNSNT